MSTSNNQDVANVKEWNTLSQGIAAAQESIKNFNSSLNEVSDSIKNSLVPVLAALTDQLKELVQWYGSMSEWQQELTVSTGLLSSTIPELLTKIGEIGTGITMIYGLGKFAAKHWGTLSTLFAGLADAFLFIATNPIALVIAAVAALAAGVVYLWNTNEEFRENVIAIWENIQERFAAAGAFIAGIFTEAIPNAISAFLEWMKEFPENLGYLLGLALGTVEAWRVNLHLVAFQCGKDAAEAVLNFFAELPEKLRIALTNALNAFIDWGYRMLSWVEDTIPKVIDHVMEHFWDLPKALFPVGAAILPGLWDGIMSEENWLWEKIKSFTNGFIQGFKDGFQIKSPSRVMVGIGEFIVEGLDEGLKGLEELPVLRVKAVAEAITSEFGGLTDRGYGALLAGSVGNAYAGSTVNNSSSQNTTNFTFHSPKALSPREMTRQMRKAQKELLLGFN